MNGADETAGETVESPSPRPPRPPQAAAPSLEGNFAGGRFVIEEQLGSGGMGVVYKATQVDLGRRVALKVLRSGPGEPASPTRRERFVREARAAARLKHPYVVPVHEIGQEGDLLFFTMDLCEGETLAARLKRGRLPLPEALELMRKVLEGLGHAHAQGLVHRDMKPGNIMIEAGDVPKIMDFGLAKQIGEDSGEERLTHEGTLLGTPHYMPPEQAAGRRDEVDARSDLYACGVLLYELTTGKVPFESRSFQELMSKIFSKDPDSPRKYVDDLPLPVEGIILKALEKDRARRYQTAADMRRDIERVLAGESVPGLRMSAVHRIGRRVKRQRVLVSFCFALGGGAITTVIAVTGAMRASARQAEASVFREVHSQATERIEGLFGSAHRMLRLLHGRAERGELRLDRVPLRASPQAEDPLARELIQVLASWEAFSWVSFSTPGGDFVGAYRIPGETALRLNRSHVSTDGASFRTVVHEDVVGPNGLTPDVARAAESPTSYDPRKRPFYKAAEAAKGIVWTEPYVFWEGSPGITAATAVRDARGVLQGVLTIDFQTAGLWGRLGHFSVGPERARFEGDVFLFTPSGHLLASTRADRSSTTLIRGRGAEAVIVKGKDTEDAPTRALFAALVEGGPLVGPRDFDVATDGATRRGSARPIRIADVDLVVGILGPP